VHMPHGMQDEVRTNHIHSDVGRAYVAIEQGAEDLAKRLTSKHDANWTMIVGDWNLNIKSDWVRPYMLRRFNGYTVNWHQPYPARGTFEKTIIDFALLRGIKIIGGPEILSRQPGFDHVGWRQTLA
jgi:hypothetical protein